MSKLHRYRIPRWPHDARTAIFRWSPDFLTSDGDRQVPRQSPLDDLPIAVGASAEISVILKVNRAATEQSPGGGRQTSGAWLLRPGSRSKKSGDHLPMPQNRNRRKIGGSPRDSKSLWRRLNDDPIIKQSFNYWTHVILFVNLAVGLTEWSVLLQPSQYIHAKDWLL